MCDLKYLNVMAAMLQPIYKLFLAKIYKIFLFENSTWWVDVCYDRLSARVCKTLDEKYVMKFINGLFLYAFVTLL